MEQPLSVLLGVPEKILEGLASGEFVRYGGTIRMAAGQPGGGKIVALLNDAQNTGLNVGAAGVGLLPGISAAVSIVNVGLTVAGFAVLFKKLEGVSRDLRKMESTLAKIEKKVDFNQIANLRAGAEQCRNSTTLSSEEQRELAASHAINNLLQARHYFELCAEKEVEDLSSIADEYIYMFMLAHMAEVQTYLNIGENQQAREAICRAALGSGKIISQFIQGLICNYLPIYLLPEFKGKVTLDRISDLMNWSYEWESEGEQEYVTHPSFLFEAYREESFALVKESEPWWEQLPPAVVSRGDIDDWWLGPVNFGKDRDKYKEAAVEGVPKAFEVLEGLVENHDRMRSYLDEIDLMNWMLLDVQEWSDLKQLPDGEGVCILLSEEAREVVD